MAEALENLVIRISSDVTEAKSGIQRLAATVEKLANALDTETSSEKKNTSATKENTKETSKNEKEHKKAGESSKHHASGLAKLAAALKRILIYRAIRGVIKAVEGAIKDGIKRMYEWSTVNDQVFMRVMDTYATEVQYLKDALGAAIAPLIERLMPILEQLVDWFVELINKVQQFFRALAGEDKWLKVKKGAAKYASETDKAAKAQKALNEQLMDFDKLNVITTPKSPSSGTTEETSPLDGDWVDIDPKIKKIADEVNKIITDLKDLFDKMEDSGVWASLKSLFTDSAKATWDLIKTIFDKIANTKAGSGLSKLIDGINKFSVSGIENFTKVINKWSEDGTLDALAGAIGDILGDLASIADNVVDIILDISSIIGTKGESGNGLWLIHYILGLINGILSGIKQMLEGDFAGGLKQILISVIVTPILAMVRSIAQCVELVDKLIHPNDEEVNQKWADFYNKLDTLEGKINGTYTEVKTGNSELKKGSKYWATMAVSAGTSYEKLYKYAKDAYGKVTDTTMKWALEDIKAGKTVDQARETRTKSTTKTVTTATKKIGKAWLNLFQKTDAGSEESAETFEDEYGGALSNTGTGVKGLGKKLKILFADTKEGAENASEVFLSEFGDARAEIKKTGRATTKWHSNLFGTAVKNIKAETDTATSEAKRTGDTFESEFGETMKTLKNGASTTKANIKTSATDAKTGFKTALNGLKTITSDLIKNLKDKWSNFAKKGESYGETFKTKFVKGLKPLERTTVTASVSDGGGGTSKANFKIETKAHGGFPDMGTMFIAGEVPGQTEMVGNINGRTGVASGQEITGIADAVYSTGSEEAMLLRQLIAAVRSQNLVISPSASLGKVVSQSQRLYAGVTG